MNQTQLNSSVSTLGWRIEILTAQPLCLYYFGAFTSHRKVQQLKAGFIEDLLLESATILSANMLFCQPSQLTLTRDELRSHHLLSKKFAPFGLKSSFIV
jgi:hypothetical protein